MKRRKCVNLTYQTSIGAFGYIYRGNDIKIVIFFPLKIRMKIIFQMFLECTVILLFDENLIHAQIFELESCKFELKYFDL